MLTKAKLNSLIGKTLNNYTSVLVKPVLIILLLFQVLSCRQIDAYVFETTYFNLDGTLDRKDLDTVYSNKVLDLFFYSQNFHEPYYLPPKFHNHKYKNDTVTIWHNDSIEKTVINNFFKTFVYDSNSNLISYTYSGCNICSDFSYKYLVEYNENNDVYKIQNLIIMKDSYELEYDDNNSVTELKCFRLGTQEKSIKLSQVLFN